ncbi:MAG TPA: FMN-binding negative transcriptional regulator [Vineibacter sp.]|nr:FMN-binding negative transcriptional regulator [Vineibacter sp.]
MYVPSHFDLKRTDAVRELMRDRSFATLVTTGDDGAPFVTHLPLLFDDDGSPHGKLVGHVARANPHWRLFDRGTVSLAIFHGPHAYISPNWYASPNLVPTWNYTAVHAYGTPRILKEDTDALAVVERLAACFEASLPQPWSTAKLPAGNALAQMRGIVAFEMPIERLQAKAKIGQNRSPADQRAAADALAARGGEDNTAVAALMRGAAG